MSMPPLGVSAQKTTALSPTPLALLVLRVKHRRRRGTEMTEHHFTCCRRCRNAHQCRPACHYQQLDTRPGSTDPQTSIPGFLWLQPRTEPGPIMMSPTCVASFRDGASYA